MTEPTLVIFGPSSLCGDALLSQLSAEADVLCLSRHRPPGWRDVPWSRCDLTDLLTDELGIVASTLPRRPQLWLSFAHIWLLAPFLAALADFHPQSLTGLRGVVACSSSSVITKRFASNCFDRELVARLSRAQEQLRGSCELLDVPARILAPTLIHGLTADHADRNVEALRSLLRRTPLLFLPAQTGLRQPIAAAELAEVALDQALRLHLSGTGVQFLPLGGDETLSFRELLERIQASDPLAARCRLLSLPTRLFQALAAPLLLMSPKLFEAVLRLSSDLCGFPRVADLLGRDPRPFRPAARSGGHQASGVSG